MQDRAFIRRIATRAAAACAARYGYTGAQESAYIESWCAAPAAIYVGNLMYPYPHHALAHAAALAVA